MLQSSLHYSGPFDARAVEGERPEERGRGGDQGPDNEFVDRYEEMLSKEGLLRNSFPGGGHEGDEGDVDWK